MIAFVGLTNVVACPCRPSTRTMPQVVTGDGSRHCIARTGKCIPALHQGAQNKDLHQAKVRDALTRPQIPDIINLEMPIPCDGCSTQTR